MKIGVAIYNLGALLIAGLEFLWPKFLFSWQTSSSDIYPVRNVLYSRFYTVPSNYFFPLNKNVILMKQTNYFHAKKNKTKKPLFFGWFSGKKSDASLEIELQPVCSMTCSFGRRIQKNFDDFCQKVIKDFQGKNDVNGDWLCECILKIDTAFFKAIQDLNAWKKKDSKRVNRDLSDILHTIENTHQRARKSLEELSQYYVNGNMVNDNQHEISELSFEIALDTNEALIALKEQHDNLLSGWEKDKHLLSILLKYHSSQFFKTDNVLVYEEQTKKSLSQIYRILAKKYHPDRYLIESENKQSTEIFQEIREILENFSLDLENQGGNDSIKMHLKQIQRRIDEILHDDTFWHIYMKTQQQILDSTIKLAEFPVLNELHQVCDEGPIKKKTIQSKFIESLSMKPLTQPQDQWSSIDAIWSDRQKKLEFKKMASHKNDTEEREQVIYFDLSLLGDGFSSFSMSDASWW